MISKDNLKNILAFLTFTVLLYIHYKYWVDGSFILFVVVIILYIILDIILHIIIKIINFIKKSPKHERFINCTNI